MNKITQHPPPGFSGFAEQLSRDVEDVEGFLYPHEARLLALFSACPTASGSILEIGSFKGRSTVVLAKAAQLSDRAVINAVDPMTAPSETDPDLKGDNSSLSDFSENLRRHGVGDMVRHYPMLSSELAPDWNEPLRLLWIDGDHTYRGTKTDFEGFGPHLADKAIIAFHDVLHEFEGGIRVFAEDVVLSPNFGAIGFCGSIAWSQFHENPAGAAKYRNQKIAMWRKLSRLIPFHTFRSKLSGIRKHRYRLYKSLIPHGPVDPQKWLNTID